MVHLRLSNRAGGSSHTSSGYARHLGGSTSVMIPCVSMVSAVHSAKCTAISSPVSQPSVCVIVIQPCLIFPANQPLPNLCTRHPLPEWKAVMVRRQKRSQSCIQISSTGSSRSLRRCPIPRIASRTSTSQSLSARFAWGHNPMANCR